MILCPDYMVQNPTRLSLVLAKEHASLRSGNHILRGYHISTLRICTLPSYHP